MPKSKLITIKAPTCKATPEQAKRQAEQRAKKRDSYIGEPKRANGFRNRHPKINSFENLKPHKIRSRFVKKVINAEGNIATIVVKSECNFSGPRHSLATAHRRFRRENNHARKQRHLQFRRRKPHGRSVI